MQASPPGSRPPLFTAFLLGFCLLVVGLAPAGVAWAAEATPDSTVSRGGGLRGVERDHKDGHEGLRTTANLLLFVPRTLVDGLLYASVYSGYLVDDSKFVSGVQDVLHLNEKVLGWYPLLTVGSGPAIGATVFYRSRPLDITLGGAYGGSQRWGGKLALFRSFHTGSSVWQVNFSGRILQREDMEFYGFGADPLTDPRNAYQDDAAQEFGIYAQRLTRTPLVIGLSPSPRWKFFYSGFYQERRLGTPTADASGNIDNIFDPGTVPGIDGEGTTTGQQIYNELAVRLDTRKERGQIAGGVRMEGYGGLSQGVGDDHSRSWRAGLDAAVYVPVIKRNRVLAARAVFDMVENLNHDVDLSFAEYPRQPTFRGVSGRTLLRTDNYSLVSSLEYQWPITFNLRARVFLDYLMVAESADKFTFANAPYAAGLDIDLHTTEDRQMARLTLASGSEGLRFQFTVGLGQHISDRTKWQ